MGRFFSFFLCFLKGGGFPLTKLPLLTQTDSQPLHVTLTAATGAGVAKAIWLI